MTLIETLASAVIHGFSRFVPISGEAHHWLLEKLLNFPSPNEGWSATFALGSLISLLVYFVHDWASMLSSVVQVLIYRKRPMTLDERLPFFILFCAAIPVFLLWLLSTKFQQGSLAELQSLAGHWMVPGLISSTILLLMTSRWSRRNRGPFDLNILDSVLFGVGQAISWIPGVGGTLGLLAASQARNYHLETATKNASLFSLPFLMIELSRGLSQIGWHSGEPLPGCSWVQWTLALILAAGTSFIGLRVLNESVRKHGFGRLLTYRSFVAALILAVLLLK